MSAATAPVLVACVLLVVAGAGKLRRPASTVGALRSVGAPASTWAVRCLGLVEVTLGGAAAGIGGALLVTFVATAYAAFTGFLVIALRRGGAVSACGCLGRPDTPPTVTHAMVTGALALACGAAASDGGSTLAGLSTTPDDAVLLALTALAAWLAWLTFAVLPHVRLAARRPSPTKEP